MDMFSNYQLPAKYIPKNTPVPYYDVDKIYSDIKKPLAAYNIKGELIGFTWNYGDVVILEFVTEGNVVYDSGVYEDARDYLLGKQFELIIYNFRYEIVYDVSFDADLVAAVIIDSVTSKSLLPGTYYCQLKLIDEEEATDYTLFNRDDNILYIK